MFGLAIDPILKFKENVVIASVVVTWFVKKSSSKRSKMSTRPQPFTSEDMKMKLAQMREERTRIESQFRAKYAIESIPLPQLVFDKPLTSEDMKMKLAQMREERTR